MLAHAAGTDEFEGFKYVLKADGHWRSAAEVHPRRGAGVAVTATFRSALHRSRCQSET
jgi:hypothetical protein